MNVVGERVTVVASSDPSKVGREGTVLLDTAKTLLLGTKEGVMRVEKGTSTFRLESGKVVPGAGLAGRLQDRIGSDAA
ncbi:MAG: ribonuclease P protein subunit [Nitrososphaerota archaeon]|nr:ribonuclease P protein subunit [Nitrososphaerota archaeon]